MCQYSDNACLRVIFSFDQIKCYANDAMTSQILDTTLSQIDFVTYALLCYSIIVIYFYICNFCTIHYVFDKYKYFSNYFIVTFCFLIFFYNTHWRFIRCAKKKKIRWCKYMKGGWGAITISLACWRHQHQQSDGKAPKRRLRFLPSPKCRIRLQRGRHQQPAHKK